jgi:hypothetical protein
MALVDEGERTIRSTTTLTEAASVSPAKRLSTKAVAAFIGPMVWDDEGRIPRSKSSQTPIIGHPDRVQ